MSAALSLSSIDGQRILVGQSASAVDGTQLAGAYAPSCTHTHCAPALIRPVDHRTTDPQCGCVVGTSTAEANGAPDTQFRGASVPNVGDQCRSDAQSVLVADPSSAGSQAAGDTHAMCTSGGWLRDPVLGVLADVVDDLDTVRIANANRVRQLTRTATDKDGGERGFGLTLAHPEVAKLALTVKALEAAEHDAILNLQRALRKHPLAGFQKRHKGIGEKQLARLLAAIGDPYWNDLYQRPRAVSELWAFTGFHVIKISGSSHIRRDTQTAPAAAGAQPHAGAQTSPDTQGLSGPGVAPKRQRGQKSNWSETARKRVWVIASAMPKFPGAHYETVYRQAREKYGDSLHPSDCVRCGPQGKPALAGSPLSDGHKHARAVRIVAKEILKDLWIEARDLYTSSSLADVAPGGEAAPLALHHARQREGCLQNVP